MGKSQVGLLQKLQKGLAKSSDFYSLCLKDDDVWVLRMGQNVLALQASCSGFYGMPILRQSLGLAVKVRTAFYRYQSKKFYARISYVWHIILTMTLLHSQRAMRYRLPAPLNPDPGCSFKQHMLGRLTYILYGAFTCAN